LPESKFWLSAAGAIVLLGATAAQAADVALETPPVYDWNGFYVGANTGYVFGNDDVLSIKPEIGEASKALSFDGFIGGGQVGANWQTNKWMVGVEADLQVAAISDSQNVTVNGFELDTKTDVDWFSTMRLRSGFALDKMLFYGTGGLALGGVDYKVRALDDYSGTLQTQDDYTAMGWSAGAGVEWGLSERSSAKFEYLYVDLGSEDGAIPGQGARLKITPTLQSVRVGIDFRF
jgi:outer membrane immunogenic protein